MCNQNTKEIEDREVFYANGTPITITAPIASGSNIGATITWDGGSENVSSNTIVFAGGGLDTDFSEGSIKMTGGRVSTISGGGYGVKENEIKYDTAKSADMGETHIEILGGRTAQIIGGGYGYSDVETAEIIMSGGSTGVIMGGGIASIEKAGNVIPVAAKVSPCHVRDVTITVSGDKVSDYPLASFNGQGSIYGGGQGYSAVDNVTMNISGNIDLTNSYVIAGGANGYTGNAVVNIIGGRLKIVQSLNRGIMDSSKINITGGTIKDLYAAGDSSDGSVKGEIGSVELNIIKGSVTALHTGSTTTAKQNLPADNNVITARYGINAEIGNLEDAKTAFGNCLTALLTDVTLDKTSLTMAIGGKETLKATVTGGVSTGTDADGVIWSSDHEDIVSVDSKGNLTAEAAGTAVITAAYAKDEAIAAACTVTVKQPELKISKKSATVKVGNELELTAEASPSDADVDIEWEIADETILEDITEFEDDKDTFIGKGLSVGETTVTAYLAGSEEVKAVCKVKVAPNNNLPLEDQVASIVENLDAALKSGPGGAAPTPEEKTEIIKNAVQAVEKTVTPAALGKLKDNDSVVDVYNQLQDLGSILSSNFEVWSEDVDDSQFPFAMISYGLLANIDMDEAGGILPESGGTDSIAISMDAKLTDLPYGAETLMSTAGAVAIDMKLLQQKNGLDKKAIQPKIPILFTVSLPDGLDASKPIKVWSYHNGTPRVLKSWFDKENEEVAFLADGFSVFVIGNTKETVKTSGGRSGGSSGWHPQGSWMQQEQNWKFKNYDGTFAADCWMQITYNGRSDWYHFSPEGFMQTGWFTDKDGHIYYLNPVSDGYRGSMAVDWQLIEGKYYYFNPVSNGTRGSLYVNTTTPDGYTVGSDGSRIQ